MSESYSPYNPLDKKNLGKSVTDAILELDRSELPPKEPFIGAGIYAIYYTGNFDLYKRLGKSNRDNKTDIPIYVGKAIPEGGRKGGSLKDVAKSRDLYSRLAKHAESIKQSENLNIKDFYCRYLTLDDVWIPLGENLLIETFKPIWNQIIEGFGNNDPGSGRHKQKRSPWDAIHPGRTWVKNLAEADSKKVALSIKQVEEYMKQF